MLQMSLGFFFSEKMQYIVLLKNKLERLEEKNSNDYLYLEHIQSSHSAVNQSQ